ncbi:Uncharacterised protein [uncultured archaeon]|nr:Uncharacterised protein [uncultured archaeon]
MVKKEIVFSIIAIIISIIALIISGLELSSTNKNNIFNEANLQLNNYKDKFSEQKLICNNSYSDFIKKNQRILYEASDNFDKRNYPNTLKILNDFNTQMVCYNLPNYVYGVTPLKTDVPTETPKNNNFFSTLTGAVTGLINSGAGLPAILFLMTVVAGTIVLVVVRRRN